MSKASEFFLITSEIVQLFHYSDAQRDTCLCRYCLQFQFMTEGLYYVRQKAKSSMKCSCANLKSGAALRKSLLCPDYDGRDECLLNECDSCRDMQLIIICDAEIKALQTLFVTWESFESLESEGTGFLGSWVGGPNRRSRVPWEPTHQGRCLQAPHPCPCPAGTFPPDKFGKIIFFNEKWRLKWNSSRTFYRRRESFVFSSIKCVEYSGIY